MKDSSDQILDNGTDEAALAIAKCTRYCQYCLQGWKGKWVFFMQQFYGADTGEDVKELYELLWWKEGRRKEGDKAGTPHYPVVHTPIPSQSKAPAQRGKKS